MLGPVELVPEVDSTNRMLLDRARAGAPAGAVLVADHQSAGRGRLDRRWEAAPGAALLVSVLLRPDLPPERLHLLTWAAGVAACEACEAYGATGVSLKWPNDVIVDGAGGTRKLAGILAEAVVGASVESVVVGMGLNLRSAPAGGIALDELTPAPVGRDELLVAWLQRLDAWLGEPQGLHDAYVTRCSTIGRRIRAELPGGELVGTATAVAGDGCLVVDSGGTSRRLTVADVVHVRAT